MTPEFPARTTASPVSTARATDCQACCSASTESENQLSFVMKTSAFAPFFASARICANDSSHKETRPIAKTAHVDNGNGYCKNCGADLKGGDRCKCGEIHTGPFAWLIKFFHTIVYFFKNLGK